MKIVTPKPYGVTKDAFIKTGPGSKQFIDNFDSVFKNRTNRPGHTKIVYHNGKRTEIVNPSTNTKA